mgnify:CR=1 FL=1
MEYNSALVDLKSARRKIGPMKISLTLIHALAFLFVSCSSGEEHETNKDSQTILPISQPQDELGVAQDGTTIPSLEVLVKLRREGRIREYVAAFNAWEASQRAARPLLPGKGRDDEAIEIYQFAIQVLGEDVDVKAEHGWFWTEIMVFGKNSKEQFDNLVSELTKEKKRRGWNRLDVEFILKATIITRKEMVNGDLIVTEKWEKDRDKILFEANIK